MWQPVKVIVASDPATVPKACHRLFSVINVALRE